MSRLVGLEFGDIVINHGLRKDNPEYCGVFVEELAKSSKASKLRMTDTRGRFWEFMNDQMANLEVDSHIDFEAYLRDYHEKLKAVSNA